MSSSEPEVDAGTNIKNAFAVVLRTYEALYKFFQELDSVASEESLVSITPSFLRSRSEADYNGWLLWSFIKLFQKHEDPAHATVENLRQGAVYGVEVDLLCKGDARPLFYLSRFEYDPDLNLWTHLPNVSDHWRFHWPLRHADCEIQSLGSFSVSIPRQAKLKSQYWGLEKVVFTTTDMVSVNSRDTIKSRIFQPLKRLSEAG